MGIVRTLHTEWVASSTVMDEGSSSSRPSATEGTSRPRVVSRSSVLSASWRQSSRNRFFSSKISCEGTRHHDQSAQFAFCPPPPKSPANRRNVVVGRGEQYHVLQVVRGEDVVGIEPQGAVSLVNQQAVVLYVAARPVDKKTVNFMKRTKAKAKRRRGST